MNIGVIGTGYVGLVTGTCLSHVGNQVICVDIDKNKIKNLNNGKVPIYEEKLDGMLSDCLKQRKISFTTDLQSTIKKSKILFLAVSTPMDDDGSCNLDYILKAATDIGRFIDEYKIIVVKSTVPIGTTILIKNKIEKEIKSRDVNISFDIANNPEFLKEGKAINDFMYPDRIIVGLDNDELKNIFRKLYSPFSMNHEKIVFLDIPSSELTKYASNAMLAMKISFINEISQLCEKVGANINNVRIGIGSDSRIGYSFIYPSIGFGGSCFPKDVNSLKKQFEKAGLVSKISNATLEINEAQWKFFCFRVMEKFKGSNSIKNIGVWGITFKPCTDDIRESQAIKIIDKLLENKFNIKIYDPKGMVNAKKYYKTKNYNNVRFCNDKYDVVKGSDALLLLTEWEEFRSPDFSKIKKIMKSNIIFDGRNIYKHSALKEKGFDYHQIGVRTEL